jgi:hypothetical protein
MVTSIDYNASLTDIQKRIAILQCSIIRHSRTMFLQIPFWSTFYLSNNWFPQQVGIGFIILQISINILLIYGTYWLYKNHTIENLDKKWFRQLIDGSGGGSVIKALEVYNEIEKFKKETDPEYHLSN